MKIKWYYPICFLWFLLFSAKINGQIVINPIQSNIPVLSIDYLKNVQLTNPTSTPISGRVVMEIRSRTELLLSIESSPMTIAGNSSAHKNDIPWMDAFQVTDQNFIYSLMVSAQFNSGAYEYCYKFIGAGSSLLGMRCLENYSLSSSPPELKFPFNQSTIKTTVPQLKWLNPMPIIGNELNYAIKLVEVEEDQSVSEALIKNLPLLERQGLRTNFYQYGNFDIPLEPGNKYAWKVVANWNDIMVGETSTWSFTIDEKDLVEITSIHESYRSLKTAPDGSHHAFSDRLFIRYINKHNQKAFNYVIYEKGNQAEPFKRTPEVSLKPGLNQIIIDISKLKLKPDTQYMLRVQGERDTFSYLQFVKK